MNLAAVNAAPHKEHDIAVTVVGASAAIFVGATAKFAHGDNGDALHVITQVVVEGGQPLTQSGEQVIELAIQRPLVFVRIPAAQVHTGDL